MDTNPHELAGPDARARRVRALIVILTLVFIAAPFVVYLLAAKGLAPGR
jgi:NhaP-type Na+/H+ and K+/H+ antiporter